MLYAFCLRHNSTESHKEIIETIINQINIFWNNFVKTNDRVDAAKSIIRSIQVLHVLFQPNYAVESGRGDWHGTCRALAWILSQCGWQSQTTVLWSVSPLRSRQRQLKPARTEVLGPLQQEAQCRLWELLRPAVGDLKTSPDQTAGSSMTVTALLIIVRMLSVLRVPVSNSPVQSGGKDWLGYWLD